MRCHAGVIRMFALYAPSTRGANFNVAAGSSDAVVYGVGSSNAAANIMVAAQQAVGTGVLIPGGPDTISYQIGRSRTRSPTPARMW